MNTLILDHKTAAELLASRQIKRVDVIASGYEWMCPNCKTLNHEIEYTEKVTCKSCENVFETNSPEHAF